MKQSQKRTKRAALMLALMSRTPARKLGWLATMPTERAVEARESDDDVLGVVLVHLEEVAVIDDAGDDVFDVVGQVGLGGDDGVERFVGAVDGVGAGLARRVFEIVRGDEAEAARAPCETFGIVVGEEVGDAGFGVVGHGSAELVLGDLFVGDGLDDVGAGDEHVGGLIDHEDEVGDGGGVDRAAGAGSHDGGDLRDDAGGENVAQEDVGVAGERPHAFLNARAAGIVEADDGCADAHGACP